MVTSKPVYQRIISILSYLALVFAISFLIIGRHTPSLEIGDMAPISEKITLLNAKSTTLKAMLNKPMVINFWATWCPPCESEMPTFSKMADKYQGKVRFVGPAIDSPKEDMIAAKKEYNISYDLGFMSSSSISKWRAQTLPTTYIIDTKGRIIWAKVGVASPEKLEAAIKLALSKKR